MGGGSGFVGEQLCKYLRMANYEVRIYAAPNFENHFYMLDKNRTDPNRMQAARKRQPPVADIWG